MFRYRPAHISLDSTFKTFGSGHFPIIYAILREIPCQEKKWYGTSTVK